MQKLVAIAFAAASLLAGPAVFVGSSSSALAQQQCKGPGVPEAWLRPGGYCEQLNNLGSTIEQPKDECNFYLPLEMMLVSSLAYGERVHVADGDCTHELNPLCGSLGLAARRTGVALGALRLPLFLAQEFRGLDRERRPGGRDADRDGQRHRGDDHRDDDQRIDVEVDLEDELDEGPGTDDR
jgi:hypothetical protein